MKNFSLVQLLLRLSAAAAVAGLIACANTPSGPTASPGAAPTPTAAAPGISDSNSSVNLASCLGGSGDSACFSGARIRRTSLASSPITSAPVFNNNNPVLTSGPNVTIAWTAPVIGFPTSYMIEASSTPSGPANLANFNTGSPSTTFFVPGVPTGVYYVRIRAVDASGPSAASNEVQVVVGVVGGACPSAPRNLTVVSQAAGTITLTWLAPLSGAPTSYLVQAGSAAGLANLASFDTGSTGITLVAPNVPAGSYFVRVYGRSSSCSPANNFLGPASNEVLVFVVGFTGDVQVSVSWDAPSDVDLHVVEPSGAEIYYANSSSASGGQLDVDSNPACFIDGRQIENIRWGNRAPGGTYIVRVDYYDDCGVARTNFLVTVKNGSSTQTFAGNFTGRGDGGGDGSGRLITTFTHAASVVAAPLLDVFRAPALFTPSPEKLRKSRGQN